jgi:hypothetical protein
MSFHRRFTTQLTVTVLENKGVVVLSIGRAGVVAGSTVGSVGCCPTGDPLMDTINTLVCTITTIPITVIEVPGTRFHGANTTVVIRLI